MVELVDTRSSEGRARTGVRVRVPPCASQERATTAGRVVEADERRWWNGRHTALRRPGPRGREGSSPSLRTGSLA